jgi:hypothetical protein
MLSEGRHHDIVKEGTHSHFLFGGIVENPETNFVAEALIR